MVQGNRADRFGLASAKGLTYHRVIKNSSNMAQPRDVVTEQIQDEEPIENNEARASVIITNAYQWQRAALSRKERGSILASLGDIAKIGFSAIDKIAFLRIKGDDLIEALFYKYIIEFKYDSKARKIFIISLKYADISDRQSIFDQNTYKNKESNTEKRGIDLNKRRLL